MTIEIVNYYKLKELVAHVDNIACIQIHTT